MVKIKKRKRETGGLGFFLLGILCSGILIVVSSFIMAVIASGSGDPTSKIGAYSLIALLLSAAISGICISRIKGDGGFGVSALTALAVALIMTLIGIISSGGRLTLACFMNYGCYLGVSVIFAYLGRKKEKRHKRIKHK